MQVENNKNATYGGRHRMPLEERAKIFSPFDPITGFREALCQVEREVEEQNLEEWEREPKVEV